MNIPKSFEGKGLNQVLNERSSRILPCDQDIIHIHKEKEHAAMNTGKK